MKPTKREELIQELTTSINNREGTNLTTEQVNAYIGSDMSDEKLDVWVEEHETMEDIITSQDVLDLVDGEFDFQLIAKSQMVRTSSGYTLNLDTATAADINIMVGYLLGRFDLHTMKTCMNHNVKDHKVFTYNPVQGEISVIPDYYHDHSEAHTLLIHHGIAIAFYKHENAYLGAPVKAENNNIKQDDIVDSVHYSDYINRAGLGALIKKLSASKPQKIIDLISVYED